jgi:hypothetical protein
VQGGAYMWCKGGHTCGARGGIHVVQVRACPGLTRVCRKAATAVVQGLHVLSVGRAFLQLLYCDCLLHALGVMISVQMLQLFPSAGT